MNELLINPAQNTSPAPYFLIDFKKAAVGDKVWNVQSTESWNFVRSTQGTPTDGVVDHPTFGKCYRLDGNVAFREPTKRMNLLKLPYFRLEIDFVTDVAYAQLMLTGSASSKKSGWNVYTWQGTTWLWTYIVPDGSGGESSIPSLPGSVPVNVMNRVSLTKQGNSLIVKDEVSGATAGWNIGSPVVTDNFFCIGCTETGFGGAMKGYLKRYQVYV